MESPKPPSQFRRGGHRPADVAVVGAGPVGLALAVELSRMGFSVVVLDRRPPLSEDANRRPQLLVARPGDLAHLERLGVDVRDPRIVAPLAERCTGDLARDTCACLDVDPADAEPASAQHLSDLVYQAPVALIPIARLQQALLARAVACGAEVRYHAQVVRLRRHARASSLSLADGDSLRASLVVIATGASRALVDRRALAQQAAPSRRLIAGVFDATGDTGRWLRVELPVRGFARPARCTLLQPSHDSEAGTALLVDAPVTGAATDAQLRRCFEAAATAHGLDAAPYLVEPQAFTTSATAVPQRVIAGDNRAPVVIAGDAAQTGHVFTGMTCFVNVALALALCDLLRDAHAALADAELGAPTLARAFAGYERTSNLGARLLAETSRPHMLAYA